MFDGQELEIRGEDYKYVDTALEKLDAIIKRDLIAYHGVEYQEIEFWDQLKNNITQNNDGSYDYSKCVGQTITSYGWISTSIDRNYAEPFVDGEDWTDNNIPKPPLKEPALFIIKIPKGYHGAAYIQGFNLAGEVNKEFQVLIKRNSKLKITNWYKNDVGVNYFELDLIS